MTKEQKELVRVQLRDRQQAYRLIFCGDNGELNAAGKAVVSDLEVFCRAKESTFHPNERIHVLLEGRREVMLRIQDYVTLPFNELVLKYDGRKELLNVD